MLEVRPRGANDAMRTRRRHDPARPADKERIVEGFAQAAECLADSGLAHPEPPRCTADAQLVVKRDRDREQIEIGGLRSQSACQITRYRAGFEWVAKNLKMSGMLPEITLP